MKLLKSANVSRSYSKNNTGTVFWDTVYFVRTRLHAELLCTLSVRAYGDRNRNQNPNRTEGRILSYARTSHVTRGNLSYWLRLLHDATDHTHCIGLHTWLCTLRAPSCSTPSHIHSVRVRIGHIAWFKWMNDDDGDRQTILAFWYRPAVTSMSTASRATRAPQTVSWLCHSPRKATNSSSLAGSKHECNYPFLSARSSPRCS